MDLKLILAYTTIVFIVVNILNFLVEKGKYVFGNIRSDIRTKHLKSKIYYYIKELNYSEVEKDFNESFIDEILGDIELNKSIRLTAKERIQIKAYTYMLLLYRRDYGK